MKHLRILILIPLTLLLTGSVTQQHLMVVARKNVAAPGGGDLTFNELSQGSLGSNGGTTNSVTPTANAQVIVTIGIAVAGGGVTDVGDSITISGCGISNWTEVAEKPYGPGTNRRTLYVWKGSAASPSTGSLTITFTSAYAATWQETMYSIDEVENADGTTPFGTVYSNNTAGATSMTVTVSDTPDAGDMVFAAFGVESTGVSATLNSELDTTLTNLEGGAGFRTLVAAYDSAPDSSPTPGITWTGTNSGAGVAFVVNKAP